MPLSEFYRPINGKNEPPQQKATDISYIPNDEFMELIWEKGQIMMQGQSSRARKTQVSSNFQFHTPKVQEKGLLDVSLPEMGLNQDDDMVTWLNYPLDDYCSDLLPEISGVTVNDHSSINVIDKRGSSNQSNKDSHSHVNNIFSRDGVGFDQSNTMKVSRSSHLFSWSLDQVHNPDPSVRSGVLDISSSNCRSKPHNVIHKDPVQIRCSSGNLEKMVQKQDSILPYSTSSLLNFSHFSRPAAMAKATLQKHENHAAVHVVNHGPQKEIRFANQSSLDSSKLGSKPIANRSLEEPNCVVKSCTDRREDATTGNVVVDSNAPKGGQETEKSNEPVGASSSVCSGNSVERASNDLTKNSKRKSRDSEDFECQSQDVEEESLGTKTVSTSRGGTGSKRSRAAEVHNLSERRRRDRINEKMRALQELIPNCNKVDKASMLDEAIEYLKTLQLQVQIMSMGTGLCMPPMMFPTGIQHMPHFSPMGIGMGMSYGMGVAEMNNGPQGHPHMFPSRLPVPSPISGLDSCPRSPFQVYGHPGMLFSQPPVAGFPMNAAVRQMGTQAPSSKDLPVMTQTQISSQSQVASKSLNQPALVDKQDEGLEAGCSTDGAV